jgi:CubicO group peptidase (beta-lactamase class C family)
VDVDGRQSGHALRISSMTKPMTAAAVLALIEGGPGSVRCRYVSRTH